MMLSRPHPFDSIFFFFRSFPREWFHPLLKLSAAGLSVLFDLIYRLSLRSGRSVLMVYLLAQRYSFVVPSSLFFEVLTSFSKTLFYNLLREDLRMFPEGRSLSYCNRGHIPRDPTPADSLS